MRERPFKMLTFSTITYGTVRRSSRSSSECTHLMYASINICIDLHVDLRSNRFGHGRSWLNCAALAHRLYAARHVVCVALVARWSWVRVKGVRSSSLSFFFLNVGCSRWDFITQNHSTVRLILFVWHLQWS